VKPTDRKRKVRAVKEEATRLCSRIVRYQRGPMCENGCGRPATDHAHIVGRTLAHTRTDETNGLALCGTCHHRFDNYHDERAAILAKTVGHDHYLALKAKAEAGVNVKFDWYDELDRLRALAEQIGIAA
jgi:hypothetical protein